MKTIWTKSEIAWCASHDWFLSGTQDKIVCLDESSDGTIWPSNDKTLLPGDVVFTGAGCRIMGRTIKVKTFLPEDGMQAIRDWAGY